MSDTKPCGQHTVWEPQCRTCARLAGLEKERDTALADRDPLATLREFQPAIDALDDASAAWALAGKFGSPEERAKTEAEYDRAREYLISLCQAALDRKR
jgi:hypothetical protein